MKAFVVAFLVVAAVSQGYAQFWQGFQSPGFQPPQVNFQELAQQWTPAVQNWRENMPALPTQGFQLPQVNYQEWAQQIKPAVQNWGLPQMPANFGQLKETMQSPFAQNLKSQIPSNVKQVMASEPFKNWAENVMKMPQVQGLNLPA